MKLRYCLCLLTLCVAAATPVFARAHRTLDAAKAAAKENPRLILIFWSRNYAEPHPNQHDDQQAQDTYNDLCDRERNIQRSLRSWAGRFELVPRSIKQPGSDYGMLSGAFAKAIPAIEKRNPSAKKRNAKFKKSRYHLTDKLRWVLLLPDGSILDGGRETSLGEWSKTLATYAKEYPAFRKKDQPKAIALLDKAEQLAKASLAGEAGKLLLKIRGHLWFPTEHGKRVTAAFDTAAKVATTLAAQAEAAAGERNFTKALFHCELIQHLFGKTSATGKAAKKQYLVYCKKSSKAAGDYSKARKQLLAQWFIDKAASLEKTNTVGKLELLTLAVKNGGTTDPAKKAKELLGDVKEQIKADTAAAKKRKATGF